MPTFKPKACGRCGKTYTPTGPCAKYCTDCKDAAHKAYKKRYHKGRYVRKGYAQSGKDNNAYKNGIGTYKERALAYYGSSCTTCGSNKFVCVHHVDEDRTNNELDNLEVLCRSCHAKRHNLVQNLVKRDSQCPQ